MARAMNFPTIPLSELTLLAESTLQEMTRRADAPKPIVLVVDDEAVIADTLTIILDQGGLMAMTAYDARTALEMADLVPPDLLLSDVVMPGMNGVDLAITIRKAQPDCKILLFSGTAANIDLLSAAGEAGRDFVVLDKPIHPTELLARVSQTLDHRAARATSEASEREVSGSLSMSA